MRLWLRWQSLTAIAFFLLNVDFVVMPVLASFGVCGWRLFWAAAFFATVEPVYWDWYAKWVVRNVKRTERIQRVTSAFVNQGLWQQCKAFARDKFDWFVEHARIHANGGGNEELRERAVALVRGTNVLMAYPLMLGLGIFPSGWPLAIFLNRIFPVPGGFILFLAANAVKTYLIGLGYLSLPWWAKLLVVVAAALLLAFGVRNIVRKVSALVRNHRNGLP